MKKSLSLNYYCLKTSLLSAFLLLSTGTAYANEKAAFVYVAHKNDYGWSYSHDIGRLKAEKALNGKFKTSFIENIGSAVGAAPEGPGSG